MEVISPHPGVLYDQQYDELYVVFLIVYLCLGPLFVSLFMLGKYEKEKIHSTTRMQRPLHLYSVILGKLEQFII